MVTGLVRKNVKSRRDNSPAQSRTVTYSTHFNFLNYNFIIHFYWIYLYLLFRPIPLSVNLSLGRTLAGEDAGALCFAASPAEPKQHCFVLFLNSFFNLFNLFKLFHYPRPTSRPFQI